MRVRQSGGMVEFIPNPQEKREALVRDHSLQLQMILHQRLSLIEDALGLDQGLKETCEGLFKSIEKEEKSNLHLNQEIDKALESNP